MAEVSNAAWGGRRPDGTYPLPTPELVEEPRTGLIAMSARDLTSIGLLLIGLICGVAGGAIAFGWAGALIAVAAITVPVALMIGAGD